MKTDHVRDELSISSYNSTLVHPTVSAAIHHFARQGVDFDSSELIGQLARADGFPAISVGELLSAARVAGVELIGAFADVSELDGIALPFLTFLKLGPAADAPIELVQVEQIRGRRIVIWGDRFGETSIPHADLLHRWSGIVLMINPAARGKQAQELQSFRNDVRLLPGFVTPNECRELIRYCEEARFKRSRVIQRRNEVISNVIQTRVRSSSSVVLSDRSHPVLARLYTKCARLEGVRDQDIETIQCVRYKRGQKFKAHYDGGINLPRLTTYLLYLNDSFTGGETYFPMLSYAVSPAAGACLRFPSCDLDGRVLWPSEHGGLPVQDGVKYALNIWVRCPSLRSQSEVAIQIYPPQEPETSPNLGVGDHVRQ